MATAYLSPFPPRQMLDDDGFPLSAGLVHTYAAGTSTPLTTYVTNSTTGAENTNPIELDSAGRAHIYIPDGVAYKFVVQDEYGALVDQEDGVMIPTITTPPAPNTIETGTIVGFGAGPNAADVTDIPSGYLACDGSAVSRSTYAALYAVIGDNYGNGDGTTTFNLPDTRNTILVGAGATYKQGDGTYTAAPIVKTTSTTLTNYAGVGIQFMIKT